MGVKEAGDCPELKIIIGLKMASGAGIQGREEEILINGLAVSCDQVLR